MRSSRPLRGGSPGHVVGGPEADMLMLLTGISDAVERHKLESEGVVMIETEKGFEVSILTASGSESVGGLFYDLGEG